MRTVISVQLVKSIALDQAHVTRYTALLVETVAKTLEFAGAGPNVDASLVLSDDAQLHQLNRQFLGIDAPTDVLAFPDGETDRDTGNTHQGDVILSYPRALAQAESGGHPVEAEMQLLVVHGMLHLLGYDHTGPEQKAAMWAAQAEILSRLGCAITGPPL